MVYIGKVTIFMYNRSLRCLKSRSYLWQQGNLYQCRPLQNHYIDFRHLTYTSKDSFLTTINYQLFNTNYNYIYQQLIMSASLPKYNFWEDQAVSIKPHSIMVLCSNIYTLSILYMFIRLQVIN